MPTPSTPSLATHVKSVLGLILAAVLGYGVWFQYRPSIEVGTSTRLGDAHAVMSAYQTWKITHAESTTPHRLAIALGWSKSLSTEQTTSHGIATLDLDAATLTIELPDFPKTHEALDVWLVDNRTGNGASVLPENEDRMVHVGTLSQPTPTHSFSFNLDTKRPFAFDLIILSSPAHYPTTSRILTGSLTLFQRFYMADHLRYDAQDDHKASLLNTNVLQAFSAVAPTNLADLVAAGERLFFEETFDGNGRTCGTCHRQENNFTIDPDFIATLPDDDPLFIAEFNDSLNARTNGGRWFENPQLMRSRGLIVANVDGFDDLANKFTMRSVPYTLGMALSLTPGTNDGTTTPPNHRMGWSGDGAPGSGTLREFAIGAVTQHFPKTLARLPGSDFRLPTEEELDALEAFQLALGRQEELDIESMTFSDPTILAGRDVFINEGKCSSCHLNAGANFFLAPDQNFNFDTGVEDQRRPRRRGMPRIPRDGGFGQAANETGGFGNGTFNTPSLIEAADTAPYFHDNSAATLEDAIAFYNTNAFNNSPGGVISQGIDLNRRQIRQVAVFLRAINALENIREASALLTRATAVPNNEATEGILLRAQAECADARDVWAATGLDLTSATPRRRGRRGRGGTLPPTPILDQQFETIERITQASIAALHRDDERERNRLLQDAVRRLSDIERLIVTPTPVTSLSTHLPATTPSVATAVDPTDPTLPDGFFLEQNYPNPFNPSTAIRFHLPAEDHVTIRVYNSQGQLIHTLADQSFGAGIHEVTWDASASAGHTLPSGTYFYQLVTTSYQTTKSMILLK